MRQPQAAALAVEARDGSEVQRPAGQLVRRLQLEEIDELTRAHEAGTTVRQLAESFGLHKETARAHLARAGITHRPGCTARHDEAEEPIACRLHTQGLSLKQVGALLRVTDNTVLTVLRKHGVQTRRRGHPPLASEVIPCRLASLEVQEEMTLSGGQDPDDRTGENRERGKSHCPRRGEVRGPRPARVVRAGGPQQDRAG